MEKYLLDSDTLINLFKNKFFIVDKIDAVGAENCFVSEVTIAELLYGASFSDRPDKHFGEVELTYEKFKILPISKVLEIYGSERARLRKAGTPVDSNDVFIAATALRYDLTLVSGNTKHMSKIENLKLEDWTKPEHNEFAV